MDLVDLTVTLAQTEMLRFHESRTDQPRGTDVLRQGRTVPDDDT